MCKLLQAYINYVNIMVQDKRNTTTKAVWCIHAFLVTHAQNQEVLSDLVSKSKSVLIVSLDPAEIILIQDLQNSREFQDISRCFKT